VFEWSTEQRYLVQLGRVQFSSRTTCMGFRFKPGIASNRENPAVRRQSVVGGIFCRRWFANILALAWLSKRGGGFPHRFGRSHPTNQLTESTVEMEGCLTLDPALAGGWV